MVFPGFRINLFAWFQCVAYGVHRHDLKWTAFDPALSDTLRIVSPTQVWSVSCCFLL